MMEALKVSVVVPCFNYGRFLAECLESVREQTCESWECIVIDDGSTDDTSAVAGAYAARDSRYICVRQDNRGLSAARNIGLRKARGTYVQLLDADDLIENDKLRQHAAFLDKHEHIGLVYGPMAFFSIRSGSRAVALGRHGVDRAWMKMWPDSNEEMLSSFIEGNQFPVSAAVFRRSAIPEIGYFDEALRSHEDWEFWLRWAFAGQRFVGLDAEGTRTLIREHGESLTMRAIAMAETKLRVRQRIEQLASSESLRAKNREWERYDRCELGAAHLAAGNLKEGARLYVSGFVAAERKFIAIRPLLVHLAPRWLLAAWRRWRSSQLARDGG